MISSNVIRLATFIAVLICARAEFNLTREVGMFIEQTEDFELWRDLFPLKDLEEIQEDSGKYLQVGSHVGDLIAAAAYVEFEEGSEEQNALRALHSKFWAQIKCGQACLKEYNAYIAGMRNYVFRNVYVRKIKIGYYRTLALPLRELAEIFRSMTNKNLVDRAKAKDIFISACESNIINHGMLDYLDRVYRIECPIITDEDVTRLIRVQEAFRQFENQNKMNTSQDYPWNPLEYQRSKKQIMTNIRKLTVQQSDELISKLESTTFSFVQRLFYSVHRNFEDFASSVFAELRNVQSGCIPEVMFHASDEVKESIASTVYLLKLDLIVIEAMTAVCTNISTGGYEKRMRTIFTKTLNKTQTIVSHMKTWIEQTYVHTVPRVGIEAAKRYIDNKEFRNEAEYDELARQMWLTFRSREPTGEFRYILTVPASPMDRWWSIMQTANATGTYTNLTNYNGVDVHVFRYDFDYSYEWEQQVTEWMEQNREAFRAILRDNLNSTSAEVMQALNGVTNETLCSAGLYRSAFLFGGISENGTDVLMGKSTYFFSRRPATESVEYAENGRHWKLYFIV